jgi:prolyl-tRNA synthetase
MAEAITPRSKDYSQWYLDIVKHAGMAENSDVRGCTECSRTPDM